MEPNSSVQRGSVFYWNLRCSCRYGQASPSLASSSFWERGVLLTPRAVNSFSRWPSLALFSLSCHSAIRVPVHTPAIAYLCILVYLHIKEYARISLRPFPHVFSHVSSSILPILLLHLPLTYDVTCTTLSLSSTKMYNIVYFPPVHLHTSSPVTPLQ